MSSLCRLDVAKLPEDLQKNVLMMTLRLTSNPPTISPGNYFNVDRSLLTSIVCSLTTYLIILVQFRDSE
ncbi:unnamed protein product [Allacma fusca]|uniref:Gustatory receptor n=1 Tax=Allacma fusca TaxID=39272 RepID=A0A8J2J7Q9_9HEXA|nr:unnamed protein product [Allacma fusca]